MIFRAVIQCLCIGFAALAVGFVHSRLNPVTTWESTRVKTPVSATPMQDAPPSNQSTDGSRQSLPSQAQQPQPLPVVDERMVTLARFRELMAAPLPVQVIDAREPGEFAAGRIAGALNLPPTSFKGGVPEVVNIRLSRDLPVVVYCGGGDCDASKYVALRLKEYGFAQTYVYQAGFAEWTASGLEVER